MKKSTNLSPRQDIFKELFVGTLIYVVVLGFLNDYTSIVTAKSFSTIFLASLALEILTYLAFKLKSRIVQLFHGRVGKLYRFLTVFGVWFIMFSSKFIFIWVLDVLFGNYILVEGFFGILLVVVTVTLLHKLANMVFTHLADD